MITSQSTLDSVFARLVDPVQRALWYSACLALLNFSVPLGAIPSIGKHIHEEMAKQQAERDAEEADLKKRSQLTASRPLTTKEQEALQGSAGENPYFAGQSKWDIIYKRVNLMNGNYSFSLTDLAFEKSFGIAVAASRSYSANNPDEGPFGKGWTLGADAATTAGGVIKSSASASGAVPITFKERPSNQLSDPNAMLATGTSSQPPVAVTATDGGGKEFTIQRDVDGILTTPPWDKNTSDPVYEFVTLNGTTFQVLVSNKVTTPDGIVYHYEKRGHFVNGSVPFNNSSAQPEASNLLKLVKAVDRHGNETVYTYDMTRTVNFQKANGLVQENPLTSVSMPSGAVLRFNWGDGSPGKPANRIASISDTNNARTVSYEYSTDGLLVAVTTPAGKRTTYQYGSAYLAQRPYNVPADQWPTTPPTKLLTGITSPNGLTETVKYCVGAYGRTVNGYLAFLGVGVRAYELRAPNGAITSITGDSGSDSMIPVSDMVGQSLFGDPEGRDAIFERDAQGRIVGWSTFTAGVISGVYWVFRAGASNTPSTEYSYLGYNATTQDLVETKTMRSENFHWWLAHSPSSGQYGYLPSERKLAYQGYDPQRESMTVTKAGYNFLGRPLFTETSEGLLNSPPTRVTRNEHSYWGADKYFQEMAVKDHNGRIQFTDYYPNTALPGEKGEAYRLYNSRVSSFAEDQSIPLPAGTLTENAWRYRLRPVSASSYANQFQYDSKGRQTIVSGLRSTQTTPWTYRKALLEYSTAAGPSNGQLVSTIEDYGGINRKSETLAFNSWGKAIKTRNAKGFIFETQYDNDGLVQSVVRTDVVPSKPILNVTYGATAGTASFGQPITVVDGQSGVTQALTYYNAGVAGAAGQIQSISHSGGGIASYSTEYTYNPAGDREIATYNTPQGTERWGYYDYISIGDPGSPTRVFQTLVRLTSTGARTNEELHYHYALDGRLLAAAFAQTPSATALEANGSWYSGQKLAASRAVAYYEYDSGGRTSAVRHYWETLVSGQFQKAAILANTCTYELTGLKRGFKTSSKTWVPSAPNSPSWTMSSDHTFGYDAASDFLTSANYNDGLPNPSQSWTYDLSGNRNDVVADALNRPTSEAGLAVTTDTLGNRLTKGGVSYTWDSLSRLSSRGTNATYAYRADGLRVAKTVAGVTTQYRHDGKFTIQEARSNGTTIDSALGARGIDWTQRRTGTTTAVYFPLYDAHGNAVASLSRAGAGGWAVNELRTYDAWGNVRSGAPTGDPSGRYGAKYGHVQDDESGLIYMRARYYDPATGRFISEDPAKDGGNWFAYCLNNPVNFVDESGLKAKAMKADIVIWALLAGFASYLLVMTQHGVFGQDQFAIAVILAGVLMLTDLADELKEFAKDILGKSDSVILKEMEQFSENMQELMPYAKTSLANPVILAAAAYAGVLYAELYMQELEGY